MSSLDDSKLILGRKPISDICLVASYLTYGHKARISIEKAFGVLSTLSIAT
jgi:hypothetical protein